MIFISKTLDFKLYKNNNLKIFKNNIAYLKNFDKILFELDKNSYSISNKENIITFIKEDAESIFKLELGSIDNCSLLLKELKQEFPIKVEKKDYIIDEKKIKINYKIESDEEETTLEIIL